MNTNFKVIGLTQLGIKPGSTGPEADALTTQPSELLKVVINVSHTHKKFVRQRLSIAMSYKNCD